MPASRKPELFNMLKATGAPLTTTYTKYKIEDLEHELAALGVDTSEVRNPIHTPAPVMTEEAVPPFRIWSFLTRLLPSR
jgi:hypothetical protein